MQKIANLSHYKIKMEHAVLAAVQHAQLYGDREVEQQLLTILQSCNSADGTHKTAS